MKERHNIISSVSVDFFGEARASAKKMLKMECVRMTLAFPVHYAPSLTKRWFYCHRTFQVTLENKGCEGLVCKFTDILYKCQFVSQGKGVLAQPHTGSIPTRSVVSSDVACIAGG